MIYNKFAMLALFIKKLTMVDIDKYWFDDMDIEWFFFEKERKRVCILFNGCFDAANNHTISDLCELTIRDWDEIQVVKFENWDDDNFVSTDEVLEFHELVHKELMKDGIFNIYVVVKPNSSEGDENWYHYRFVNPLFDIRFQKEDTYKTVLTEAELPPLNPTYVQSYHLDRVCNLEDLMRMFPIQVSINHENLSPWERLEKVFYNQEGMAGWLYYVVYHQDISCMPIEDLTNYCRFMLRQRYFVLKKFFVFTPKDMETILPIVEYIMTNEIALLSPFKKNCSH